MAGAEEFTATENLTDFTSNEELTQYYPPINLYDEKPRKLAKAFGLA